MPHYLIQVGYNTSGLAGLVKEPQDRIEGLFGPGDRQAGVQRENGPHQRDARALAECRGVDSHRRAA